MSDSTLKKYELAEKLINKTKNKEIPIILNGHYANDISDSNITRIMSNILLVDIADEHLDFVIEAVDKGEKLEKPFPLHKFTSISGTCHICSESLILYFDGQNLFFNECTVKHEPFDVLIPFPSGKLVMQDDLREYIGEDCTGFDINTFRGLKETTLSYAKENVFHTFVGNSCPSFSTTKDKEEVVFGNLKDNMSEGSICTDLWWITVMDESIFRKQLEVNGYNNEKIESIVNSLEKTVVEKGWYKATSNFPVYSYDNDIYAYIVKEKEIEDNFTDNLRLKPIKQESKKIESFEDLYFFKRYLISKTYPDFQLSSVLTEYFTGYSSDNVKDPYIKNYNQGNLKKQVLENQSLSNFFTDEELIKVIPKFSKDLFLLSPPDYRKSMKYSSHSISNMSKSRGNYYPAEVSLFELTLNLLIHYNLYLNIEEEALQPTIEECNSKEDVLNDIEFVLNLAYTNMNERNVIEEVKSLLISLTNNYGSLFNESNPNYRFYLADKLELRVEQFKFFNNVSEEEINDFLNSEIDKKLNS